MLMVRRVRAGWTNQRFSCPKHKARAGVLDRYEDFLMQEAFAFREVERMEPQPVVIGIREVNSRGIALHHVPDTHRDRSKQFPQFQIRDDIIIDVQKQFQPIPLALQLVLLALQLPLRESRSLPIQGGIDGQGYLIRTERKKFNLLRGKGIGMLAANHEPAQPPVDRGQRKRGHGLDAILPEKFTYAWEACF